MSFMDKVGEIGGKVYSTASKTASSIADKSKIVAERTKLKHKINEEKSIISKKYMEIGKKFYELNKNIMPETYVEEITAISNSMDKISELNNRISELGNETNCSSCKGKIQKDQEFCHLCGEKTGYEVNKTDNPEEVIEVSAEDIEVE
ncbi:MAG: hypothetical protein GX365_07190 [Clostridiales bacterium]|nr:hypothetical protein [Clostridiales bacterium]